MADYLHSSSDELLSEACSESDDEEVVFMGNQAPSQSQRNSKEDTEAHVREAVGSNPKPVPLSFHKIFCPFCQNYSVTCQNWTKVFPYSTTPQGDALIEYGSVLTDQWKAVHEEYKPNSKRNNAKAKGLREICLHILKAHPEQRDKTKVFEIHRGRGNRRPGYRTDGRSDLSGHTEEQKKAHHKQRASELRIKKKTESVPDTVRKICQKRKGVKFRDFCLVRWSPWVVSVNLHTNVTVLGDLAQALKAPNEDWTTKSKRTQLLKLFRRILVCLSNTYKPNVFSSNMQAHMFLFIMKSVQFKIQYAFAKKCFNIHCVF